MALGTSRLSARAVAPAACTVRWEPQAGIRAWDKERTVSWLLAQTEATQLSDPKRSWWELLIFPPPSVSMPPHLQLLCALAESPCPNHQAKGPVLLFASQTPSVTSHLTPLTPFWKQCTAGVQPCSSFPQGSLSCCTLPA